MSLQTIEEAKELVPRVITDEFAHQRFCFFERLLFHRQSGLEINLSRFNRFVPKPQRDDRSIHATLQQVKGHGVSKDVNGDTFSCKGWTGLGGSSYMPEQQVMHGIGAQGGASEVGKQDLPVAACRLAKPGFQYGHCGFGKRDTSLLAALPNHTNMSTRPENEIIACQAAHFRLTEPRLRRHQEKRVIAPSEPSSLIRRSEQCLDLRAREEMNLGSRKALAGDGQHALDLGGMGRRFERSIPKEGVDGGEAQVPAAHTQLPVLLQVIEKANDQGCIDRLEAQVVQAACATAVARISATCEKCRGTN